MEDEIVQIRKVCDQIKEFADQADNLAQALGEKTEQTRKLTQRCYELRRMYRNVRELLVKEFGEDARDVNSTTLIKRLIAQRNECKAKLDAIINDVQNDEQVLNDERNANIKKILIGILSQTPDKQVADLAKLHTVKGQSETIVRQREEIETLKGQKARLIDENLGLKGEIAVLQKKSKEADESAVADKNAIRGLESDKQALYDTLNFVAEREANAEKSYEEKIAELTKLNEELKAQLKNAEKYKISTILKNFAIKVKSIFRSKQDESCDDDIEKE